MSFFSENLLSILVACIVILVFIALKKRLNYFSNKGLTHMKPRWRDIPKYISADAFNDFPNDVYERCRGMNTPYVGFFNGMLIPSVLVLDPSFLEKVLIKDFTYFQDHGFAIDPKKDPLMAWQLFNLKGDEWRTLRHKLVPTFTSGKLRGMVPIMEECADSFIQDLNQDPSLKKNANLKDLFKRFSLSVIVSCVFGIDPESVKDPDCHFRKILNDVMKPTLASRIKFMMAFMSPKVNKLLNFKLMSQEVEDFMLSLTEQTFEVRKKTGTKRNDFVQLLFELKEKGSVALDVKDLEQDEKETIDQISVEPIQTKLEFTNELLMAQMFVFLIGGFDNIAFLTAICQHVLAKHPEVQSRAREEVKQIIAKHGGINYDALRNMKFLGVCIDEALRLYTPALVIIRECNRSYTLPDGKTLDKGSTVLIPAKAFHMDNRYWTEPEKFNPDRFLNGEPLVPGTYMPFGDGPRMCIAQRMALLFTKLLLAKLLLSYKFLPSSLTKEPVKLKVLLVPDFEGGLFGTLEDLEE